MTTDWKEQFEGLVQEHMGQIEKFKDHVTLVRDVTSDESVKTFLAHMLQEETERREKTQSLLSQVRQLELGTPLSESPTGHYARRDQNELTVGSLMGLHQ